ncbi:hypothetical protein ACFW9L_16335 [Streptomyces sp. NPDC059517]|uniref:hypothetical protein n=1 Tax=Streptomyces sp. NPDC059517 TaxID=3346855 RepID=UPI00368AFFAC
MRRIWRVELRSRAGEPHLFCLQCQAHTPPLEASSARSAALAHLASHARTDALPGHLRTCQCRTHGCSWHPRSRGCAGPVLLALTRDAGGRSWRLADTCAACAAATSHTALVPDTLPSAPRPQPTGAEASRRAVAPGPSEAVRVREMLTYLSAALPQFTSPAARLLALQCALRCDTQGHLTLPAGLLRGMRMHGRREAWLELAQASWLQAAAPGIRPKSMTVRLLDTAILHQTPGRRARHRAAHWALHPAPLALPAAAPAAWRLTALVLAAHAFTAAGNIQDMEVVARLCGHSPQQTKELLDRLVSTRSLTAWQHHRDTDELQWQHPPLAEVHTLARRTAARLTQVRHFPGYRPSGHAQDRLAPPEART